MLLAHSEEITVAHTTRRQQTLEKQTGLSLSEIEAIVSTESFAKLFGERDCAFIKRHFGLSGNESEGYLSISEQFGVSRERVRQICAVMLNMVRDFSVTQSMTPKKARSADPLDVFTYSRGAMCGIDRNTVCHIRSNVAFDVQYLLDGGKKKRPRTMPEILDMCRGELLRSANVGNKTVNAMVDMLATLDLKLSS